MEVTSDDDVGRVLVSDGFGRGLEAQIFFFLRGKEVPPQFFPCVSRGDIYRFVRARAVLVQDALKFFSPAWFGAEFSNVSHREDDQ